MSNAYLGDHRALVRTVDDCLLFVDTRDMLLAPSLLVRNVWEPEETALFKSLLRPGMTFIDVGANIGYYTVLAGKLVTSRGKVWAFEPEPRNFEILRRNIIINGMFSFIEGIQKAVYRSADQLQFHVRKNYGGNSSIGTAGQAWLEYLYDEEQTVTVEATALDDQFAGKDLHVDLMKVDVEGAEPGAFAGMRGLLSANPAVVVLCEWCPGQMRMAQNTPEDLISEFRHNQFHLYRIGGGTLTPIDEATLLNVPYCNILPQRQKIQS